MKELVLLCPIVMILNHHSSRALMCVHLKSSNQIRSLALQTTETGKVNGRKSFSVSACRGREKRKLDGTSESGTKLGELVLQLKKQRYTEREEREKRREKTTS